MHTKQIYVIQDEVVGYVKLYNLQHQIEKSINMIACREISQIDDKNR